MKKSTVAILFLFASVFNYAQGGGLRSGAKSRGSGGDLSTILFINDIMSAKFVANKDAENVEGSVYLFPKWEDSFQIFVTEEKGYNVENLNYNIVDKKIQSKISKDSVYEYDSSKIAFVKNKNKIFKFFDINNSNELYQVIFSSKKITFIKGSESKFIKGNVHPASGEIISKNKHVTKEKFFVKLQDGNFKKLELKKKNVLKLFGDKAIEVEKFVTDNKLDYDSEGSLFRIFHYYDSL